MAYRPRLQGHKDVSTPLHRKMIWQISQLYKVCFYSHAYRQEYYLIMVRLIHLSLHLV